MCTHVDAELGSTCHHTCRYIFLFCSIATCACAGGTASACMFRPCVPIQPCTQVHASLFRSMHKSTCELLYMFIHMPVHVSPAYRRHHVTAQPSTLRRTLPTLVQSCCHPTGTRAYAHAVPHVSMHVSAHVRSYVSEHVSAHVRTHFYTHASCIVRTCVPTRTDTNVQTCFSSLVPLASDGAIFYPAIDLAYPSPPFIPPCNRPRLP